MGKSTLILILGAVTLFAVANVNVNNSIFESGKMSFGYFNQVHARNVANSMIQILLSELGNDFDFRVDPGDSLSLLGGLAEYKITDCTGDDSMLVKIEVNARYPYPSIYYKTQNTVAYAAPGGGWVPPFVRGAWTANANLDNTISDMYIDGRNHDYDLSIDPPNSGRPGVSTSTDFVNTQNAAIGGTSWAGVDYPMTYPEDPAIIEENYDWGGTFPVTPDEILGYPEGTLVSIAKSGAYGSQYVNNPPMITIGKKKNVVGALTYPLSGVTYVRIDNGKDYEFFFQQNNNSGMLIVHGDNREARLVGVKYDESTCDDGLFTGLLVTDYSFHHHIDILGAVLQLSPNLESDKECKGNKDHWVYYSSAAIEDATRITSEVSSLIGNNTNFKGFGSSRIPVSRVYE
ncbi:hypothetical protein ACFLR4_00990 [Bacteroidota bacterium]